MTLHTPTPWKQGANKLYVFQDCSLNKEHIAVMSARPDGYYGQDENEANAAFIVRAVNNFEPLVAALQDALNRLEHLDGLLLKATGSKKECELGEVTRVRAAVRNTLSRHTY